ALAWRLSGQPDVTMIMNGSLAGLVGITASANIMTPLAAVSIGCIAAVVMYGATMLLERFELDDVVGAVPVHLICGIWGTLAVPFSNTGANFGAQILGIVAIGAFVVIASTIVWVALKMTVGIRLDEEAEVMGADQSELGLEAYPEFGHGSQRM
ncbi:MAG: ammonium transporter, partial [Alphaproteobacteria bacterium]